jgi:hypothetical protein
MIQALHFIDGKRCFVKERGIYFEQPGGMFLFLSLEVMLLKNNNADLTGTQDATEWYIYAIKSTYCMIIQK